MGRTIDLERGTWKQIRHAVHVAARQVHPMGDYTYSNELIVLMEFWRVEHGKPMLWAAHPRHYGRLFRPRRLPSYSQFNRRIASDECQAILQLVHNRLAAAHQPLVQGCIDGKPLPVSPVSKDPDARNGHITGGFAKGYKLHVYINQCRRIVVWSVTPLNVGEALVAMEFLPYLPPQAPDALNLADGNYDGADLYKGFDRAGSALLTPLRNQQQRTDGRHHPVTLRQMGAARRAVVDLWDHHPDLAHFLLKSRNNVEGVFSVLSVALDLHLPGHVRRLGRVRRWVGVQIILYHARLLAQDQAAAA
jgi:hypothetical protein